MLGHKKKESKLFYCITLEDLVPEDNYYRRLDKILDLSFLYERCSKYYGKTGNPSIDPVVFFKMCIYGYLENITSDRALERKIRDTLSGRYFIGYDIDEKIPWHSTISRTRSLLPKEVYEELFNLVLRLCIKYGMVSGEIQAIDSTLVKANASFDKMEARKPEMTAIEYVEKTIEENSEKGKTDDNDNDNIDNTSNSIDNNDNDTDSNKEDTDKANKLEMVSYRRAKDIKKERSNKNYYSPTDQDSRIAKKPRKPTDFYYTDQISVDIKKNIITHAEAIHSDIGDSIILPAIVQKVKKNLENYGLRVMEILTDGNYYSAENLKKLADMGIRAIIPTEKVINNKAELTRDDFTYDKRNDQYICIEGQTLKFKGYNNIKAVRIYQASSKACNQCIIRHKCCAGKGPRKVHHSIYKEYVDEALELEKTEIYREAMIRRKSTVEPVFADAKDNHGLRRINARGINNADKIFKMTAIVQNLKKLMKYGGKKLAQLNIMNVKIKSELLLNYLSDFTKPKMTIYKIELTVY